MADLSVDCVIPTHGRPTYLREALRSVLGQTCPPVSVTVVSDDDEQESRQVVAELSGKSVGAAVAFVRRTSGTPGASASRNLGARTGRAALLAFLDDDDVWAPTFLERALTRLARSGTDAVVAATQKFSDAGPLSMKVPLAGLDARAVFRRNSGVTGSNLVLTRDAFCRIGGFDPALPVQNDRDLFLRLLAEGCTYDVEPTVLVGVRQHGEGRLTDASARRADGILLFDEKYASRFGWWDRRTMHYTAHYTRMSAASSRSAFVRSALRALTTWSPTVAEDLPLDLFRGGRVRKLVRELVRGSW